MADTNIDQQEQDANSQLQQLQIYKQQVQSVANSPVPERKYGSNVTSSMQQDIISRKNEAQNELIRIKTQEQNVKDYLSQVKEYKDAEKAQGEYDYYYNLGQDASRTGRQNVDTRTLNPDQRKAYQSGFSGYAREVEYAKSLAPPQFTDTLGQGISIDPNLYNKYNETKQSSAFTRLNKPQQSDLVIGSIPGFQNVSMDSSHPIQQLGVVTAYNRPSDIIGSVQYTLSQGRQLGSEPVKALAGFGSAVVSGPILTYELVTRPVATSKAIYSSISEALTGGMPQIGEALRNEPAFSVGQFLGNLAVIKAPDIAVGAVDIYRTLGLKELPSEKVIAPEFFKGQTYPQIAKGQTAGELLKEFQAMLPGETRPAGFTASPNPLKNNLLGAGSSELPGLYQAPLLSAKFLKVSGEEGAFSLNPFPTLRPTAFRITPEGFELVPGVGVGQKAISPLSRAKQFFKEGAELGKSYIPFVKREKESVILAGTSVIPKPTRFYFEFEGRRIPIKEYDVIKSTTKGTKVSSIMEEYSRYGRVRSSSPINPYSVITSLSKVGSYSSAKQSSSLSSFKSSSSNVLRSYSSPISRSATRASSISITPSSVSFVPGLSSYVYGGGSSKSTSNSSRRNIGGGGSYGYGLDGGTGITLPPTKKIKFPELKRKKSSGVEGYRTFVIYKGKQVYLPGIREKGRALFFGESVAEKSLRATFGVTATRKTIRATPTTFTPDSIFRNYRIRAGRKIPLQDTYIQKLGKRLAFVPEIRELQSSRRKR